MVIDAPALVDEPLVSVIVPTHDMGRFLPIALRSVFEQTYRHFEIQVVDDGSTDDTPRIMEQFRGDPRVHFHRQPRGGVSAARNLGIRCARGEFVALLDADDMWLPDKLALQVACLTREPSVGVAYTNVQMVDLEGRPVKTYQEPRHDGRITDRLVVRNFVTGCSSMIRRHLLVEAGLYDETLATGEDYDLWLRLSLLCEFRYIHEITYLYRQWPGQASRHEGRMIENALRVREEFVRRNPGRVSRTAIREAWTRSFVGRGLATMRADEGRVAALRHLVRALRYSPASRDAWRAIAKVVINRV